MFHKKKLYKKTSERYNGRIDSEMGMKENDKCKGGMTAWVIR